MITVDDLVRSKLRLVGRFEGPRGPAGWFREIHECVEHPRLTRKTTYGRMRNNRREVVWLVDGIEVGDSMLDAIEPLNQMTLSIA